MKRSKAPKQAHTPNTKFGMGDFYGTGIKQKSGRMREDFINDSQVTPSKMKKPPKSLA